MESKAKEKGASNRQIAEIRKAADAARREEKRRAKSAGSNTANFTNLAELSRHNSGSAATRSSIPAEQRQGGSAAQSSVPNNQDQRKNLGPPSATGLLSVSVEGVHQNGP